MQNWNHYSCVCVLLLLCIFTCNTDFMLFSYGPRYKTLKSKIPERFKAVVFSPPQHLQQNCFHLPTNNRRYVLHRDVNVFLKSCELYPGRWQEHKKKQCNILKVEGPAKATQQAKAKTKQNKTKQNKKSKWSLPQKSRGSWNEKRTLKHLPHTGFVFFYISVFLKNETRSWVFTSIYEACLFFRNFATNLYA